MANEHAEPQPLAPAPHSDGVLEDQEVRPTAQTDSVTSNLEAEVDQVLSRLAEDDAALHVHGTLGTLEAFADYVPREVIDFVRTLTRAEWLAACALQVVDEHVCQRLGVHSLQDRRNRWNGAWTKRPRSTEARLRRARDEQARVYHSTHVGEHETYQRLPTFFRPWRPDSTGCLVVHDPEEINPSIGSPGFLEQTPVKVLRWVHEIWLSRHVARLDTDDADDDVSISDFHLPKIWDLTCGSGTTLDYFQRIHGCEVLGRDLALVASGVEYGCLSDFQSSANITGRTAMLGRIRPTNVIRRPDIILIDPPSRGTPTHAELYGEYDRRDLASATRAAWVEVTTRSARRAATYLAPRGVMSLLVRHGARDGRDVVADPQLLQDVKHELRSEGTGGPPPITIAHEMPITYERRRNQTSLGQARVPATHLLLVRGSR